MKGVDKVQTDANVAKWLAEHALEKAIKAKVDLLAYTSEPSSARDASIPQAENPK
jgi:hypothetical protein